MNRPAFEVADVFRLHGDRFFHQFPVSPEQLKVMNLVRICRTAALGGHLKKCDSCAFERPAYNSCRNRHCPKCQTMTKEQWLNDRRGELLPTGYFHVVFTLPHLFNPIIHCNKKRLLGGLFESANEVLTDFAKDPQWRLEGRIGFIAVLHTWSQTLMDHFHLHCLIPAGALSPDETRWKPARRKYLFRNTSLAKAFKRRYLQKLRALFDQGLLRFPGKTAAYQSAREFEKLLAAASGKEWIVYAKRPFSGPEKVLDYLGRYTHRVAISNHRIVSVQNGKVSFTYRDRRDNNRRKTMALEATEFIRRFLLHVLPDGFMKIRYFGYLSHRHKNRCIPVIRRLIDPKGRYPEKMKETIVEIMKRLTGMDMTGCPKCGGQLLACPLPIIRGFSEVAVLDSS